MAASEVFLSQRPRLFGIAYRMLGSVSEAEDVLQEAYLRWQAQSEDTIAAPERFLTTVVVRLCLDQLKSARARRVHYVGPWLPEPLLVDDRDPADAAALADTLSMAFLVLLEELTPAERAAFLLHDVFDYDYADVAAILNRSEPACRQLVSRARTHLGERRRRFDPDPRRGRELAARFLDAVTGGDVEALMSLLTDDVVVWTDGGGKVKAAPKPVYGPAKASRFLVAIARTGGAAGEVRPAWINGQPGFVAVSPDGMPAAAVVLDVIDGRIAGVRAVTNPDKLHDLHHRLGTASGRESSAG